MSAWARVRSWLDATFHRARTESEMDAELRFHLEARRDDLVRSGLSPDEALRRARLEFGGVEGWKEECREARGASLVETFVQDARFGLRILRKSPGFTAAAVATLALGIGANTAIFSVVYAVLLRPLPYPHPERLAVVFEAKRSEGIKANGVSYVDLEEWRRESRSFAELAGTQRHQLTLTGRGEPTVVDTVVVTPEVFALLGVQPLAGRTLSSEDGGQGAAPVVLLGEGLWRGRFGADPGVIGSAVTLDQRVFTVVGVMPAGFKVPTFTGGQEVFVPLAQDPLFGGWMARRGGHWLRVLGRLRPEVSLAQAQAEMDTLGGRISAESPEDAGWTIHVAPLQQALVGDVRAALLVLVGAVGLVLMIAVANLASLLLARATTRTREIAIRLALGAGRGRLVRQLLTEGVVLAALGAVAGLLVASWGVRALGALLPADVPRFGPIEIDGWVLAFALVLSVAASLVFGLAPALSSAGSPAPGALAEGSARAGEAGRRGRARSLLVAAETALAVVLTVGAGLLFRSLLSLTAVDPGFDAANVLKLEVSLPRYQYSTPEQWSAFSTTLLERVQSQPGLRQAALAVPLPLADGFVNLGVSITGAPPPAPGSPRTADYVSVSPEYFGAMGIPLLRGRGFSRDDSPDSRRVAIVNAAFARTYFAGADPLERELVFGFPPDGNVARTVVGVVGDVRDVALHQEPGPMMYVPFEQAPFWGGAVVVRTPLAPAAAFAQIREVVRGIDKDLPVTDAGAMADAVAATVAEPRFRAVLVGLFGVVGLLLAAAGIFGVVSYSVSCRTREIGLRVALGASPRVVRSLVLREGLGVAAGGLAVGLVAALALGRLLASQLYGVGAADPTTLAASVLVLLATALAASYLPARRATRVDPTVALRHE